MPHGALLGRFVEAVLAGDAGALPALRADIRTRLGDAALVDAAATVASFNAVVKIADATGIPLEEAKEERTRDFRTDLGIEAFRR